jgi:hypothetical protein
MSKGTAPRLQRHSGILLLSLGLVGGLGSWIAVTWHIEIAADVLAACAVACFVLCLPLLIGPVSRCSTTDCGDGPDEVFEACGSGLKDAAKACGAWLPAVSQEDVVTQDPGDGVDVGDIGGDVAQAGFDCDFDLPFF